MPERRSTIFPSKWQLTVAFLVVAMGFSSVSFAKTTNADSLRQVEGKVQDIVARVLPATVGIGSVNRGAGGSGVIVSKDGLILTAAHVVAAIGDDVIVYFPDGRRVKAKKLGADNDADAAMVKITEGGEYPFVPVGDSKSLKEDDWMVALGHAGGFQSDRTPPVRLGRLLGRNRRGFLTTDCTLIGGDSGGPLFDIGGKVVGIHSNIGASLTSNNHVSIKAFHDAWQRMEDGDVWGSRFGSAQRPDPKTPVLGITPRGDSADEVELEVLPGSPAETAGVESGDILLKIDGQKLSSYATVRKVMAKKKAGDEIPFVVKRKGEEKEFTVKALSRAEVMRNVQRATRERDQAKQAAEKKEPPPKKDSPTEKELDALLRAHLDRAKEKGGRMELTPDMVRELGGMRELMQRLRKIIDPKELAEIMGDQGRKNDEHLVSIMTAFTEILDDASLSVIPLMQKNQQVALGTAVRADGYMVTKASELGKEKLIASIDELTQIPAEVIKRFPLYDLALIKVDADLIPVAWHMPKEDPALGSIVAAAGTDPQPLAVGVISVSERNLSGSDKGFLGVSLGPGIRIDSVQKGSPAALAGLQAGDVVTKLNGKKMADVTAFVEAVKNKRPGDTIRVAYNREKEEKTASVKLASREAIPMRDTSRRFPGGELSTQRSGYPNALQTDLPIRPQDCGGPIVDLQGRILGVNVARAGRIKSYAIPAETIEELLSDVEFE